MRTSYGCFKGLYRGTGIYWNGLYNAEGSFPSRTLAEIKQKIDASIAEQDRQDAEKLCARLAAAKARGLWAERAGDRVTVHTPDGVREMSIRQYRNEVFDIEDRYDQEIVLVASAVPQMA